MSTRRTLALLDALLAEIERDREDDVLTLPIVHDEFGPEESLVAAAADHVDGVLVQVADRLPGSRGPLNRPLAQLVTEAFARARLDLEFEETKGWVVGRYIDHPEPGGGLKAVLRLAEVLVSSEIDRPIAIVSYPLEGMDAAVAQLAWELGGISVATSPPPSLRTFVPVAVGEVSVPRHCRPQNSVKLAVQQDRLIKRGGSADLDAAVRRVLIQPDQPLVLFLGAGASASAGMSSGDSIRDDALRRLVGQRPTVEQLVMEFRQYVSNADRWRPGEKDLTAAQFRDQLTLERVLREEFHDLAGRPRTLSPTIQRLTAESASALERLPDGRKALRELAKQLPRLVVGTINFDQLVEHDLGVAHEVLASPEDFATHRELVVQRIAGESDLLPILKLHGTIEVPDSLVASVDKTEFGLPSQVAATLDAMLAAAGGALTWVWIGCSMRDMDLRIWLGNHDGATELTEWWVDPLPSQTLFEYARHLRESHWARIKQSLTDRLITETADVFLRRLADYSASLA